MHECMKFGPGDTEVPNPQMYPKSPTFNKPFPHGGIAAAYYRDYYELTCIKSSQGNNGRHRFVPDRQMSAVKCRADWGLTDMLK